MYLKRFYPTGIIIKGPVGQSIGETMRIYRCPYNDTRPAVAANGSSRKRAITSNFSFCGITDMETAQYQLQRGLRKILLYRCGLIFVMPRCEQALSTDTSAPCFSTSASSSVKVSACFLPSTNVKKCSKCVSSSSAMGHCGKTNTPGHSPVTSSTKRKRVSIQSIRTASPRFHALL